MGKLYDADWIRSYYDEYGMTEWNRWDKSAVEAVKFQIHLHYLRRYVSKDDRVLEIGAGAGRFTRELARITNHVVVADLSPAQLELNRKHSSEHDYANSIDEFCEVDVLDLAERFPANTFNSVVCYGGVVSYTLDQRGRAIEQLAHVTRPGGHVLISVMCLFGTVHQFLPQILGLDPELNKRIVRSGDITEDEAEASRHRHHLFRSHELRSLIDANGLTVVAMSASNSVSAAWDDEIPHAHDDPGRWNQLIEMEVEASAQTGCLDMGTHIIAVGRKP